MAFFSNVDFVGRWRLWFAISAVLLLVSLGALLVRGLNLGIDFEGGSRFVATGAQEDPGVEGVRAALPGDLGGDAQITAYGDGGYEVRTPVLGEGEGGEVRRALGETLGAEVSVTEISPTFGGQIRNQALQAVGAALLIIVLYISFRFQFAFAVSALVALAHDILLTVGFYALVGREVNLVTVVAVLTVLGYSLYDTIIIFDRIRENTPDSSAGYNRRRFEEMANLSVRQVILRSIYTSLSTLIPITALLIFGETTLSDFAFALLVGIAAGTYSSIFIATPVLCLYKAWRARSATGKPAAAG